MTKLVIILCMGSIMAFVGMYAMSKATEAVKSSNARTDAVMQALDKVK